MRSYFYNLKNYLVGSENAVADTSHKRATCQQLILVFNVKICSNICGNIQ